MFETLIEFPPLLYAGAFLLGTVIGSFLNVVILRIPPMLEHDWRCQCSELLELEKPEGDRPPGFVLSGLNAPNVVITSSPGKTSRSFPTFSCGENARLARLEYLSAIPWSNFSQASCLPLPSGISARTCRGSLRFS